MTAVRPAFGSTIAAKYAVAVTGVILAVFVLFHMIGNLQVFLGPEAVNSYAAFLKSMPGPLWGARLILLAAFVVHIWGTFSLWRLNRRARPVRYAAKKPLISTFASRTMLVTGVVLLLFVVYHLAHFTVGLTHPEQFNLKDPLGRHDVYSMTVLGFRNSAASLLYLATMLLLGLHLSHGVASTFQTIGWRRVEWKHWIRGFGLAFALAVVIGNIVIVVACWSGLVQPTQGI